MQVPLPPPFQPRLFGSLSSLKALLARGPAALPRRAGPHHVPRLLWRHPPPQRGLVLGPGKLFPSLQEATPGLPSPPWVRGAGAASGVRLGLPRAEQALGALGALRAPQCGGPTPERGACPPSRQVPVQSARNPPGFAFPDSHAQGLPRQARFAGPLPRRVLGSSSVAQVHSVAEGVPV